MASGRLVFSNWMPALDADGVPIPNAQMFFYVNRTTTLAVVYADEALTTPLANPVLADSSGQFVPVWADQDLLFSAAIASTTLGQFDTIDDLAPSNSVGGATNKLDRDGGNPEPGFLDNVGAAALTGENVQAQEFRSALEIGPASAAPAGPERLRIEVTPEQFRTGSILTLYATNPKLSNTQALQAAINAVSALGGGSVRIDGDYPICNPNSSTTDNERFAIEGKPWVRIHGGSLVPDSTVSTVIIFGTAVSSCDGFSVQNVNFAAENIGIQQPVKPSGSYQYFGGCCIAQRNGPTSRSLVFSGNTFDLPDISPEEAVVPYHACVMADGEGIWANNSTEVCGGDCYQFNDGLWVVADNYVGECSDGGVAINNGFQGNVTGNTLKRCNLGIGGGPYGFEGDTDRDILIADNLIVEPNIGINIGWYGLALRVAANGPPSAGTLPIGSTVVWADLTNTQQTNGDFVRRSPPRGAVIDGNTIIRPKKGGVWYLAGGKLDYRATIKNNVVIECGSNAYDGTYSSDVIDAIVITGASRSVIHGNTVRASITPSGHPGAQAFVVFDSDLVVFAENTSFNNFVDVKYQECTLLLGQFYTASTPNIVTSGTVTVVAKPNKSTSFEAPVYLWDSAFYAQLNDSNPTINFDANDFLQYVRSINQLVATIQGNACFAVAKGGMIFNAGDSTVNPVIPRQATFYRISDTQVRFVMVGDDSVARKFDMTLTTI